MFKNLLRRKKQNQGVSTPEEKILQEGISEESKRRTILIDALNPLSDPGALDDIIQGLRTERLRGQFLRLRLENVLNEKTIVEKTEEYRAENQKLQEMLLKEAAPSKPKKKG